MVPPVHLGWSLLSLAKSCGPKRFSFGGMNNSFGIHPAGRVFASVGNNLFSTPIRIQVPTVEDMEDIGALLATLVLDPEVVCSPSGSTIFLQGDLGAGKTTLSRGFVRVATGDPELRVTSPTYLLSNSYPVVSNPDIESVFQSCGIKPFLTSLMHFPSSSQVVPY